MSQLFFRSNQAVACANATARATTHRQLRYFPTKNCVEKIRERTTWCELPMGVQSKMQWSLAGENRNPYISSLAETKGAFLSSLLDGNGGKLKQSGGGSFRRTCFALLRDSVRACSSVGRATDF